MRDLGLRVPGDTRVVIRGPKRGKAVALETARFGLPGVHRRETERQEDEETKEEDEKKEEKKEEAGVEETREGGQRQGGGRLPPRCVGVWTKGARERAFVIRRGCLRG